MKKIIILMWYLLTLISVASCVETKVAPTPYTPSTSTLTFEPTQKTTTPTPRTFMYDESINCKNTDVSGHIFFLLENTKGKREYTSQFDLYMSDGNGCSPRFLMEKVSGSPTLSKNGKYLAIGCENNVYLCVIDVEETIRTCVGTITEIGQCAPAISLRNELPQNLVFLNIMWWSPDETQIIVEGSDAQGGGATQFTYAFAIQDSGQWNLLNQEAICPGLFLPNSTWLDSVKITDGRCPEISPSRNKLAYAKSSDDKSKEIYGIEILDLDTQSLIWAYEPANQDQYYWPRQNIYIGEFFGESHRLLSWSPDERYIAFVVGNLLGDGDHQILRLDLKTGEIVRVTTRLIRAGSGRYLAPAWGPY